MYPADSSSQPESTRINLRTSEGICIFLRPWIYKHGIFGEETFMRNIPDSLISYSIITQIVVKNPHQINSIRLSLCCKPIKCMTVGTCEVHSR